jgi:hypothetical protein
MPFPTGSSPFACKRRLQPSLEFAGYDTQQGLAIVTQMIDKFHDTLVALAAVPAYDFHLIDTRGTLVRDVTSPTGWANEIHPAYAGFTALANRFLTALRAYFPGRV